MLARIIYRERLKNNEKDSHFIRPPIFFGKISTKLVLGFRKNEFSQSKAEQKVEKIRGNNQ